MTPEEVTERLSAAGRVLLALPTVAAITPEMREGWPQLVSRAVDRFGGDRRWRRLVPLSRADVPPMAEALGWLRFIAREQVQRVVFLRLLTHPARVEPVYSWRAIGEMMGISGAGAQGVHRRGVGEVVAGLTETETRHSCRVLDSFRHAGTTL